MKRLKTAIGADAEHDSSVQDVVAAVIADIGARGDTAVREYSEKWDNWSPTAFVLGSDEISRIVKSIPSTLIADIETVQQNVRHFAECQRDSMAEFEIETYPGTFLGQKHIPIDAVGAYIPGGRYPLLASAHMTIVTARSAGVERITACTPPINGGIPAATIAAMHLAGADEINVLGGVQAIAAMAVGTESIMPVDFITGPGNQYVAEAKRQLFGRVGIDLLAGPTEILIVADNDADAFVVAVDLLSQAEHGPDSPAVLITTSERLGRDVIAHIDRLLPGMPTRNFAEPAWRNFGEVIVTEEDIESAYELANSYASEHVEILTKDPRRALTAMRNYGALFLGEGTCVPFGDKVIGTNHTLPTRGSARYTGGLWVGKFLKTVTYQEVTNLDSSALLGELGARASRAESFEGHARACEVRVAKSTRTPLTWAPDQKFGQS